VRRRAFVALVGGAAAWPLTARAQQSDRMSRVGVLMAFDENDPQTRGWLSNFTQGLAELGWTNGPTVRIDVRWAAGSVDRMRTLAKELVELHPDVCSAAVTGVVAAKITARWRSLFPGSVRSRCPITGHGANYIPCPQRF
jgi:putative ABC transport system substrate-binding protein